jgi:ABC-2 type transport system permease protein
LQIAIWIFSCIFGIAVLNAISFIYRLSAFWTAAIVQVRNSNPSFKIMVRPFESFQGKIRFFLLTIFPALFITGIPSEILNGSLSAAWFFGSIFAVLWLYGLLIVIWGCGVRRYMLKVA